MLRVYLAGPDVFLPDASAQADRKKALCARYGFDGIFPLDAALDLTGLAPYQAGLAISRANEETMRSCDLVIANATPFRGPSIDPGTAYEVGYMRALQKPVFAYANAAGPYRRRVEAHFGSAPDQDPAGRWSDPDGLTVEDFDMADNLMIVGAVEATGGVFLAGDVPPGQGHTDLSVFEACLKHARDRLAGHPPQTDPAGQARRSRHDRPVRRPDTPTAP